MAKRRGDELNHDNWDQETESEEPGTFRQGDTNELQKRVIRKAKRSLPAGMNSEAKSSSPFSAFQGFSTACNSSPFALKSEEGDVAAATKKEITKGPQNGGSTPLGKKSLLDAMREAPPPAKKPHTEDSSSSESSHNKEYFRQLQALNSSVVKWMELNLTKNPCCDFTPVFSDYKMHIQRLEKTYLVPQKLEKKQSFSAGSGQTPFQLTSKPKLSESSSSKVSFAFGKKQEATITDPEMLYGANFASNTTNTSTFSFGIKQTLTATSTGSKSGPTSSSSSKEGQNDFKQTSDAFQNALSNAVKKKSGTTNEKSECSFFPQFAAAAPPSATGTEDEDYTPPPNDFVAVTEEDALYSKKCKLFFQKEGAYSDKGVGMLYIKKLEDKTQLLIRADTSLGNVLLNISLTATLPIERTGKNNVMIVCIPNPPLGLKNVDKNAAVPFLVRVKTSEDADELYEKLNEFKT